MSDPSPLSTKTLRDVIAEMRTIARVAGQASVEGIEDDASRRDEQEAMRCSRWASVLESMLAEGGAPDEDDPIPDYVAVFDELYGSAPELRALPETRDQPQGKESK